MLNGTTYAPSLVLSENFICGYIFPICGASTNDVTYTQQLVSDYRTTLASSASTSTTTAQVNNDVLDNEYSGLPAAPSTSKILWLSDAEIDYSYSVGSAKVCNDYSCCHADL